MADQTNEIEKLATKIKDALGTAVFDGETGDQTPESAKWEQVWKAASNGARRPRGEALDKIAQDVAQKVAERGDAPMSDDDMTEIVKTAYQAAAPAGEAPKAETITLGSPTPMDKKIDLSQGTTIDVTPVVTVKAIEPAETTADAAAPTPKPEGWTDAQIDAAWNTLTRGNPSQRPDYTPPEARGTLPVLAAAQPEPAQTAEAEALAEAAPTPTPNLPAVVATQPAAEATADATADEIPAAPLDGVPAVDAADATTTEDPAIHASEPANDERTPINPFNPMWGDVTSILYRSEAERNYIEESLATKESRKGLSLGEEPLTPEKLAFMAAYYPGLERTPAFLNAIEELARANGSATVAEYLEKQEADQTIRKDVMEAFAGTHPLLDKSNRLPFTHIGMEANEEEGSLPTFVLRDAAKNVYRDDGQRTSVRMKFGATMSYDIARNLAKTYISRRQAPTMDGSEQTLQFTVDTGRGPIRTGLGLRMKKEGYERSVMLLSVLQEAHAAGLRPEITMAGTGPYSRFALEQIALPGETADQGGFKLDAKALTEARAQCPEIMDLIEKYNLGWPGAREISLQGEAPQAEQEYEPSLGGAEPAGTSSGRRSPTDMLAAAQAAADRSEIRVPTAEPAQPANDGNLGHVAPDERDRTPFRTGQAAPTTRQTAASGATPATSGEGAQPRAVSRHVSVLDSDQIAASEAASATPEEGRRSRRTTPQPRPTGM